MTADLQSKSSTNRRPTEQRNVMAENDVAKEAQRMRPTKVF